MRKNELDSLPQRLKSTFFEENFLNEAAPFRHGVKNFLETTVVMIVATIKKIAKFGNLTG